MQNSIDLKMLRTAAIVLGVSIAVSIVAVSGSEYLEKEQKKTVKKESWRVQQMERKHKAATVDIKHMGTYFPLFQKLRKRGVIGEGDRVHRVEALAEEARNLNLASLQYTIGQPKEFTPQFSYAKSDAQIMTSTMTISMGLVHEEDVTDLLRNLDESSQDLYIVTQCEMIRKVKKIKRFSAAPNLDGGCTLEWINVKSRSGSWAEKKGGS
jgi:hypothetical protein